MQPTQPQLEILRSLVNTGIGRGAGFLNELLSASLKLEIDTFNFLTANQLSEKWANGAEQLCEVVMPFNGTLEGEARAYFTLENAGMLVAFFTGKGEGRIPIDTLEAGTLSEIANIVLNGVMGTISRRLELNLIYQVPGVREGDRSMMSPSCSQRPFAILQARVNFFADGLAARGAIVLYIEERSFLEMTRKVDHHILEAV